MGGGEGTNAGTNARVQMGTRPWHRALSLVPRGNRATLVPCVAVSLPLGRWALMNHGAQAKEGSPRTNPSLSKRAFGREWGADLGALHLGHRFSHIFGHTFTRFSGHIFGASSSTRAHLRPIFGRKFCLSAWRHVFCFIFPGSRSFAGRRAVVGRERFAVSRRRDRVKGGTGPADASLCCARALGTRGPDFPMHVCPGIWQPKLARLSFAPLLCSSALVRLPCSRFTSPCRQWRRGSA